MHYKNGFGALILTLAGLITLSTIGYLIFLKYMTVFVPDIANYSLILIAVVAGVAAFFNPCNFTALPVYLGYYHSLTDDNGRRVGLILNYGIIAALGVITFNLILGTFIGILGAGFGKSLALAGEGPNVLVLSFRGLVGIILMILGYMSLSGRGFHFGIFQRISERSYADRYDNPILGLFIFGFFYNAIGIGCAGPILAGLYLYALATGGFYTALFAFLLFSGTMAILMVFISIIVGFAKKSLLQKIGEATLPIKRISGLILLLVGLIMVLSVLFIGEFTRLLFP